MSLAAKTSRVGADAIAAKGWWRSQRWLLARRATQAGILLLFLAGPWFGLWIVKGNLASSLTLGVLPLTDPYVLLQSLVAGLSSRHVPLASAFIGAAIVLGFYLLVGGRVYCSWVCPVNPVTDFAAWLRRRMGLRSGAVLSRQMRFWLLAMTLVVAALSGSIAWELVNPVSMMHRGLIFGFGAGAAVIAAIFFFDLFVAPRGWCGHLCPVGAFYSLPARWSPLRVLAARREACNDCADCYAVCPEPLVIKPALKAVDGAGPVITSAQCTNCARCIDVCSKDVFEFGLRPARARPSTAVPARAEP
ncbi:MAG: quinol dehydrogenase ferredoxin subunit NapH [Burkholderiales bacterium]|nr:quinol dehydrogenase ferredoxin subunit NapH [Burkholderiales bacterium]